MQTIISRPPMIGSATGSSQRVPRKSSSFLSLRREKDKPPPSLDTPYQTHDSSGPSFTRQTYFDFYPRPNTSPNPRQSKFKVRETRPPSPSRSDLLQHEESLNTPKIPREKDGGGILSVETSYAFPSFDSAEEAASPYGGAQLTPKAYSRTRSRTGPSGRSSRVDSSSVPTLRFSGSSTQHTETPPRTPIDTASFRGSFENFPVVVAAPISGVETMDALVDGMNGGDDIIGGGTSMSNRARFGIPGHHPLYQPPLPTPPPGVVLGGGKRRPKKTSLSSNSGEEDNLHKPLSPSRPRRRRTRRPSSSRTASNSTITPAPPPRTPVEDDSPTSSTSVQEVTAYQPLVPSAQDKRKSIVPSISEIIRTHAPPEGKVRSRPSTARTSSIYAHSHGHATVHEEPESEPEPLPADEEAEMVSRSSIDSIADEVQRTLRNQNILKPVPPLPPSQSFVKRHSTVSDTVSICSPRSEPGAGSSIYSSSAASSQPPPSPFDSPSFLIMSQPTPSQAVAQYLRSTRLTTLLKLTRSPHASQDNPLTVSLSDLGSSAGFPVVVFLGLGCVRHIMGLYDEMAECLGLRLITIDRWGLGRTEPRSKSAKGIMQWASVVEEVLDLLHIGKCSVMAHSAGAPYALSFANKLPDRILGDICLLAPWVGGSEGGGYKWLKYVPNGILKTAQAAEWKLQAWMIGKPPTLAYEGIGYNATTTASTNSKPAPSRGSSPHSNGSLNVIYPSSEGRPRPSMGSSTFSEYDDLGDFDGRFESRSTLGAGAHPQPSYNYGGSESKIFVNKRKTSRGFLDRLKGGSSQPHSPTDDKPQSGRRLKALRSMGSLKGKSASPSSKKSDPPSPKLPAPLHFEVGLGLDEIRWSKAGSETSSTKGDSYVSAPERFPSNGHGPYIRAGGRRSISFTSPRTPLSLPASPIPSTFNSPLEPSTGPGSAYQAALGNALIAASHSESAKGTHNDLLQILNHENHPWGFSYSAYPHTVQVWYGDKDEKIAENAVRWMERNMGEERCVVKVVRGADHGLMYKSSVVVEVLERVRGYWENEV